MLRIVSLNQQSCLLLKMNLKSNFYKQVAYILHC